MTKANSKFPAEHHLVSLLMRRLGIPPTDYFDPNQPAGRETGVDVIAVVADGRRIGIQVTELDTGTEPGMIRGQEVRAAKQAAAAGHSTYGFWAQNDPATLVAAITRAIRRKVRIAAQHDFADLDEVWLLVACGIPVSVGTVSTMAMTPWIDTAALAAATRSPLAGAKYDRAFVHSILGAEQALYQWEPNGGWHKDVRPPDPRTVGPSMFDVLNDPEWLTNTERRFAREIEQVQREFRNKPKPE